MEKKKVKVAVKKKQPSFEEALQALEDIVHQLEEGRLPLANALAQYEQGVKCMKTCFEQLRHAERRIEILSGVDADGNPLVEPFDPETRSSAELTKKRARRKSSQRRTRPDRDIRVAGENDMDDSDRLF